MRRAARKVWAKMAQIVWDCTESGTVQADWNVIGLSGMAAAAEAGFQMCRGQIDGGLEEDGAAASVK